MKRTIYFYKNYLIERFGGPVHKVSLDAGMTCPNRDGTKGLSGCTFCSNPSFHKNPNNLDSLAQIESFRQRYPTRTKLIAYFQSYTNTYAPSPHLRELYSRDINFPEIVGLNIGTRPDCVSDDVLHLLNEYTDKVEVMLEIGLESFSDETLKRVNRCHDVADFYNLLERAQRIAPKVKLATHLMIGFPWENESFWMESAKLTSQLPISMFKLHNLIVVNKTLMGEQYKRKSFDLLSQEDYMRITADFLAQLPAQMSIGRAFAYTSAEHLIAPSWVLGSRSFHGELERFMQKNQLYQGKFHTI